jgi:Fe-S cluster assembly ATPase SufC
MCGPSKKKKASEAKEQKKVVDAQKEQAVAANEQRRAADEAARQEAERRAQIKQEDIQEAVSAKSVRKGMSGGAGRRSLFSSSAAGFLGRFQ